MMDAVMHERGSCGSGSIAFRCFACGGDFSVRTGDFQRCTVCCAENYCPLTNVSVEERVRRWFHRRSGYASVVGGAA